MTGHCRAGRHHNCPYTEGGACYGGITLPACYVTVGERVVATVIKPERHWACGCECHAGVGQLELFADAAGCVG